jgi:hypothetical protein
MAMIPERPADIPPPSSEPQAQPQPVIPPPEKMDSGPPPEEVPRMEPIPGMLPPGEQVIIKKESVNYQTSFRFIPPFEIENAV